MVNNSAVRQKYLRTVVSNLRFSGMKTFSPVNKSIRVKIEEFGDSKFKRSAVLSKFYEYLTAGLYGGERGHNLVLEGEDEEDGRPVRIDVYDKDNNIAYECKAIRSGRHANLVDYQINSYKELQIRYRDLNLLFVFYRHGIRNIQSTWKGSHEDLIYQLRSREQYSLMLPLSLILALHNNNNKLTYRCAGNLDMRSSTLVKTSTFSYIASDPKNFIRDLDLDPSNYLVNKYILPSSIRIVGMKDDHKVSEGRVRPFPIIKISEKKQYHGVFVKKLLRDYLRNVPF